MAINLIKWSIAALLLSIIFGLLKWHFAIPFLFCAVCCLLETVFGWWKVLKRDFNVWGD